MLDILVYLYESFRMAELAPDRDALEKRLFAAGFEEADINAALDWFANLTASVSHERLSHVHYRHYAPEETERLNDACRNELTYLVSAEILDPESREWVISGLMALGGEDIEPDHVRWMTLSHQTRRWCLSATPNCAGSGSARARWRCCNRT